MLSRAVTGEGGMSGTRSPGSRDSRLSTLDHETHRTRRLGYETVDPYARCDPRSRHRGWRGDEGLVNAMQHAKVAELYKANLVTSDGKEGSIFLAELAPGANMGKLYHPGDAFAYILEGTMLLEIAGKESVTLKAGQSGSLPPRTVHDDKNASQTAPLKFLVFHVAKKGDPLAVPVK